MNHFTDKPGWNGIRSAPDWLFRAAKPPDERPFGAYFTTLPATAPNLAARLGIPRSKLAYIFTFSGEQGLEPARGGRGQYVFLSRNDYRVEQPRQLASGETGL